MTKLKLNWLLVCLALLLSNEFNDVMGETPSHLLPLEARDGSAFQEDGDIISTSYVLPNQIFNDGKPYYASKDPISGQLDFSAKKPAGIDTIANEVIDANEKIVLNASPNIHDFLNLPVKYSSSKFVYPLVSSSYANLKYQGANKNYITNKKPTSVVASVKPTSDDENKNYFTVPTTKLMAVGVTTTIRTTTSKKPTTSVTTVKSTPTSALSTTAFTLTTPTPNTAKYTESTRKTLNISTSTFPPSTTRKKYIPMKKYSSTTAIPTLSTAIRFPDERPLNRTTSSRPTTFTTPHPITQSSIPSTESSSTTVKMSSTTSQTVKLTEKNLTAHPHLSAFPASTHLPNLDVADIYQRLGQKHTENKQKEKPSMSLSDIFNSLAEEESALASHNQGNNGFDAQGNLIQPIAPSKPSPFGMEQHRPSSQSVHATVTSPNYDQTENLTSGIKENFSNEYVSYQVQQPNVMQYHPSLGSMNNVIIPPEQQSATFILGSQQQVGINGIGSVEKQPIFGADSSVQYGTVINEDISELKGSAQSLPSQTDSTSHQKLPPFYGQSSYQQNNIPTPPSPYQQLPLINSDMPPNLLTQQHQKPQTQQQIQLNVNKDSTHGFYHHDSIPQAHYLQAQNQNHSQLTNTQSAGQGTKELLVSTNIRFPNSDDQSPHEVNTALSAVESQTGPVNGHAQPLSLQQIQSSYSVALPLIRNEEKPSNDIKFNGELSADDIQIQKHQVLTMDQHRQKLSFPQTSDDVTLSQHMEPPPRFTTMQKKSNRPLSPVYNEYTRKPISGISRPNHDDRRLPNILPQFRPNAKISHPQPNYNQEHLNASPQFAQRRQPLVQQSRRTPLNQNLHYPEDNRRVYRLPPYGNQRLPYAYRPMSNSIYPASRHAAFNKDKLYKMQSQQLTMNTSPEETTIAEDLVNNPPQPVALSKTYKKIDETKLEPVITLQMLQSQKKPLISSNDDTGSGEIEVPTESESQDKFESVSSQNGLYVVYPMKGEKENTNKNAIHQPILAHIESPSGSDYQNTPFSVVRDQPQEPILMVKNKKPHDLQQQSKSQLIGKFPYPIEKPDVSYTGMHSGNRMSGMVITPRIINGAGTETPIAIAYTPTEPNFSRGGKNKNNYSLANLASPVISEIRTDTQTEKADAGLNNDFDLRAQHLEKNFMAPFYPSVSLEDTVTSTPSNGWSVLSLRNQGDSSIHEKNKINRADVNAGSVDVFNSTTKNHENESFQPELQSGFKPIYPPGYVFNDNNYDIVHDQEPELNDMMPLALASHMEKPDKNSNNNIVTSTVNSIDYTTPIPITTGAPPPNTIQPKVTTDKTVEQAVASAPSNQKNKSSFETSLAALLFGDEETFEEGREGSSSFSKRKSDPKNVPRMGPRSLKMS